MYVYNFTQGSISFHKKVVFRIMHDTRRYTVLIKYGFTVFDLVNTDTYKQHNKINVTYCARIHIYIYCRVSINIFRFFTLCTVYIRSVQGNKMLSLPSCDIEGIYSFQTMKNGQQLTVRFNVCVLLFVWCT